MSSRRFRTLHFAMLPLLSAVAGGLVTTATVAADRAATSGFRAACVKVDTTPGTSQWLQGYGPRRSEGVHDRIYHRIAAMDDGDTVIWAAPLELFSEIAINIRNASPFTNTFYFGLTNGSLLYLPTKAAFADGGYEPHVSPFTDQAEADFTSAVTQHLNELQGRCAAVGSADARR